MICEMTKPGSPFSNQETDDMNAACKAQFSPNSRKPTNNCGKKVHFAQDEVLTETHPVEDYSRKGPWEDFARDRDRFSRRIQMIEPILDPILKSDHRQKIRHYMYSTVNC